MLSSPSMQCHDNLAIISLYLETPSPAIEPESLAPAPALAAAATDENENTAENTALSLLTTEFESFYNTIPTLSRQLSTLLSNSISDLRLLLSDPADIDDPSNQPTSSRSTLTTTTHHANVCRRYIFNRHACFHPVNRQKCKRISATILQIP